MSHLPKTERFKEAVSNYVSSLFPGLPRFLAAIHRGVLPSQAYVYCNPSQPATSTKPDVYKPGGKCGLSVGGVQVPPQGTKLTPIEMDGPDNQRAHRYQIATKLPTINWRKVKDILEKGTPWYLA